MITFSSNLSSKLPTTPTLNLLSASRAGNLYVSTKAQTMNDELMQAIKRAEDTLRQMSWHDQNFFVVLPDGSTAPRYAGVQVYWGINDSVVITAGLGFGEYIAFVRSEPVDSMMWQLVFSWVQGKFLIEGDVYVSTPTQKYWAEESFGDYSVSHQVDALKVAVEQLQIVAQELLDRRNMIYDVLVVQP